MKCHYDFKKIMTPVEERIRQKKIKCFWWSFALHILALLCLFGVIMTAETVYPVFAAACIISEVTATVLFVYSAPRVT